MPLSHNLTIKHTLHGRIVELFLLWKGPNRCKEFLSETHKESLGGYVDDVAVEKLLLGTLQKYDDLIGESHPIAKLEGWVTGDFGNLWGDHEPDVRQGSTEAHQLVHEVRSVRHEDASRNRSRPAIRRASPRHA